MGIARGVKSVADTAMMEAVLLLISDASGAAKSSVRQAIAADLEPAVIAVELRDLDAIPDTPNLAWRQRMAERAVCSGLSTSSRVGYRPCACAISKR